MSVPLPDRPNLEQLKHQAKELLQAAGGGAEDALARFAILPSPQPNSWALHDAQAVIAREHGFRSWNLLREAVEAQALDFSAALEQFLEAATDGRGDRAERLLGLHPGFAAASPYAALLLGDLAAFERHRASHPEFLTRRGGPRGWEGLHYVCHTAVGARTPEREQGLAEIARRLIAAGADPNLRFPWEHHNVRRPVLWGAMCVARSLALAEALLQAGAAASDGVTLVIAASQGDVGGLELLRRHGVDVNVPWASDGAAPLYAILQWSQTEAGVRWLLEHGAEPDPVFAANGESPLHLAAAAWPLWLSQALVERGAEVDRRRGDGRTPYALAAMNGNQAVAAWLRGQGAAGELAATDQMLAACARGDVAEAMTLRAALGGAAPAFSEEQYAVLLRAAENNNTAALEAMLACGFDPDHADVAMGRTALHAAAMAGQLAAVRTLVAHGASLIVRDREFHAPPLIWAAEGSRMARDVDFSGRDHAAVGRLLLDAGSPTVWQAGAEPAGPIAEIVEQWRGTAT
ncbi:MAG: ankyrin repeat domain-containing protein [Terriglobales bacterium]